MIGLGEGFFLYIMFALTILIVYPIVILSNIRGSNLYRSSQNTLKTFYLALTYIVNLIIALLIIRIFRFDGMLFLSILSAISLIFILNRKRRKC
jgi:uncharacterized membrane protein